MNRRAMSQVRCFTDVIFDTSTRVCMCVCVCVCVCDLIGIFLITIRKLAIYIGSCIPCLILVCLQPHLKADLKDVSLGGRHWLKEVIR